jgi:hypothetical protein
VRGAPDDVWLSYRTKAMGDLLIAESEALSTLHTIEGLRSDIFLWTSGC